MSVASSHNLPSASYPYVKMDPNTRVLSARRAQPWNGLVRGAHNELLSGIAKQAPPVSFGVLALSPGSLRLPARQPPGYDCADPPTRKDAQCP